MAPFIGAKQKAIPEAEPVIPWNKMGFPVGTICIINKKKEAIVNQSLARGWQGFYALKDNSNTQKTWKN